MTRQDEVPEFIQPRNVLHLTTEQLDAEIAARQQRRLAAFKVYEETQQKVKETRNEKLRDRLERELKGFEKEIASIDKTLAKIVDRANKIRGIRLELDDKFDINKKVEI